MKNLRLEYWTVSLLFLSGVASAFASCSDTAESLDFRNPVKRLFLHGDPMVLVEGTVRNTTPIFHESELNHYVGFVFSGGASFSQQSPLDHTDAPQDLEANNETVERNSRVQSLEFRRSPQGGSRHTSYDFWDRESGQVYFRSVSDDFGNLWVYEMMGLSVELLHYSETPDRKNFSLLGVAEKNGLYGKTLISIAFSRQEPRGAGALRLSEEYTYIAGPGIGYRWPPHSIELSLCIPGNRTQHTLGTPAELSATISEAWENWQQFAGRIGSRTAHLVNRTDNPPPFSDLNTHCIYSIPEFAHERTRNFLTTGITIPITNHSTGFIISSDVFLFEQAISNVERQRKYYSTAVHEIGHFLGLGHEFAKDEKGNYLYWSVMGYLANRSQNPSEHDYAALRALYSDSDSSE